MSSAGNVMEKFAKAATARGLRVFHLRSNDKRPAHTGWQKEASCKIDKWPPSANIGIATGQGIIVVDIDVKHGDGYASFRDFESRLGSSPKTFIVGTPSGGEHRYFKVPSGISLKNTAGKIGKDIDTRGDGGFVVGPGSTIDGKKYVVLDESPIAPMPQKWLEVLLPPKGEKPATPTNIGAPVGTSAYAKKAFKAEIAAVATAAEGGRNDQLNRSALALGSLAAGGELDCGEVEAALLAAAISCGLPEGEAKATIKSGMTAGAKSPRSAPLQNNYQNQYSLGASQPSQPCDNKEPWQASIRLNQNGNVTKDTGNAALYMAHLPDWKGCLAHDDLAGQIFWNRQPPPVDGMTPPRKGDDFKEADLVYIGHWFSKTLGLAFSRESLQQAVPSSALENRCNTMREYYEGLEWDGQGRVRDWLATYLGVEPSIYASAVGTWWIISVIARALKPGCQADHMLVLEGPQGSGKSRAIRILGGQWALGSLPDIRDKDVFQAIYGKGICEISELDAIRGAAITRIKDFLTQQVDTYRPSYGRYTVRRPRTCIFIGTTNETGYLSDSTGARRFWPVKCGTIKLDELALDRDQLFAEARRMYSDGLPWWPDESIQPIIVEQQEARQHHDAWEEPILKLMTTTTRGLTTAEIAKEAIELEIAKIDRTAQMRIGAILKKNGYASIQVRNSDGSRCRVYRLAQPLAEIECDNDKK
jgi:hypothetical protein